MFSSQLEYSVRSGVVIGHSNFKYSRCTRSPHHLKIPHSSLPHPITFVSSSYHRVPPPPPPPPLPPYDVIARRVICSLWRVSCLRWWWWWDNQSWFMIWWYDVHWNNNPREIVKWRNEILVLFASQLSGLECFCLNSLSFSISPSSPPSTWPDLTVVRYRTRFAPSYVSVPSNISSLFYRRERLSCCLLLSSPVLLLGSFNWYTVL